MYSSESCDEIDLHVLTQNQSLDKLLIISHTVGHGTVFIEIMDNDSYVKGSFVTLLEIYSFHKFK